MTPPPSMSLQSIYGAHRAYALRARTRCPLLSVGQKCLALSALGRIAFSLASIALILRILILLSAFSDVPYFRQASVGSISKALICVYVFLPSSFFYQVSFLCWIFLFFEIS
uniref:Uncharacterized protein n=1 Tax=Beta vulgaris subsp. vulgaris TaxID=3555 RepID=Q33962_BETVV|nr:unnamed protein product [Beta vulgaris subsp. vulgaris]